MKLIYSCISQKFREISRNFCEIQQANSKVSQNFTFLGKLAYTDAASSRALLFTAISAQNFFAPFSPRRNFLVSFVKVRTQSTSLGNTY